MKGFYVKYDQRHISLKVSYVKFNFDVWFLTFGFAPVH